MPTGVYERHYKTHCIRGHERTPENLNKNRSCKLCAVDAKRKYAETHKDQERKRGKDRYYKDVETSRAKARIIAAQRRSENPEPGRLAALKYRNKDVVKARAKYRSWYGENKEQVCERGKRRIEALGDSYVAQKMHIPLDEIPPAVLDMKRQLILLKRELKHATANSK